VVRWVGEGNRIGDKCPAGGYFGSGTGLLGFGPTFKFGCWLINGVALDLGSQTG